MWRGYSKNQFNCDAKHKATAKDHDSSEGATVEECLYQGVGAVHVIILTLLTLQEFQTHPKLQCNLAWLLHLNTNTNMFRHTPSIHGHFRQ